MKKLLYTLLALVLAAGLVAGLIIAYKAMQAERAAEGLEDQPIAAESRVQRGPSGEPRVVLDAETRRRLELATTSLTTLRVTNELRAYGKVLDISALAPFAAELRAADIAIELARRELARLKKMHEEGQNASLRSVEAAEAEYQKNLAVRQGIQDRLALAWGKTIAEQPDLGAFVRSFVDSERALVRLDLLPGETVQAAPATVAIALQADETQTVVGVHFEFPTPVDSALPVQSFVYLVKGTKWPPGAKVIGRIQREGDTFSGVFMPQSAIVRDQGQAWAYRQQGENTFIRRRVVLSHPAPGGWLVTDGWQAGEQVVTTGAQALLSEELKSQIKLVD